MGIHSFEIILSFIPLPNPARSRASQGLLTEHILGFLN